MVSVESFRIKQTILQGRVGIDCDEITDSPHLVQRHESFADTFDVGTVEVTVLFLARAFISAREKRAFCGVF